MREYFSDPPMTPWGLQQVKINTLVPANLGTADLTHIGVGDDSQDYAVKAVSAAYPELPAAEAICYQLALRAGIAVPSCALLTLPDGSHAFGSRFEGGVSQLSQLTINERLEVMQQCAPWISALCALDLFLANSDRHFDNALFRRSRLDNRWTLIAMDFSRALWLSGFPTTTCATIAHSGNTALTVFTLRSAGCWDKARAQTVAVALGTVDDATIAAWITELPSTWISPRVEQLTTWWASPSRTARVAELLSCL